MQVHCVITHRPIKTTASMAVAMIAKLDGKTEERESRREERLVDRRHHPKHFLLAETSALPSLRLALNHASPF